MQYYGDENNILDVAASSLLKYVGISHGTDFNKTHLAFLRRARNLINAGVPLENVSPYFKTSYIIMKEQIEDSTLVPHPLRWTYVDLPSDFILPKSLIRNDLNFLKYFLFVARNCWNVGDFENSLTTNRPPNTNSINFYTGLRILPETQAIFAPLDHTYIMQSQAIARLYTLMVKILMDVDVGVINLDDESILHLENFEDKEIRAMYNEMVNP